MLRSKRFRRRGPSASFGSAFCSSSSSELAAAAADVEVDEDDDAAADDEEDAGGSSLRLWLCMSSTAGTKASVTTARSFSATTAMHTAKKAEFVSNRLRQANECGMRRTELVGRGDGEREAFGI